MVDHALVHKSIPGKLRKTDQSKYFSGSSCVKLIIKNRRVRKSASVWKLDNIPQNNVKEKIQKKIKKISKQMEIETELSKSNGILQKEF